MPQVCSDVPPFDNGILGLRGKEYARLNKQGQVYLDYTGAMLYPESLIRTHLELLENSVLGNPHSTNPTSVKASKLCDAARRTVMEFFNASPDDYICVFTANATAGCRIVGESFQFSPEGKLLLLMDNHNSINGIREFAKSSGADVQYTPLSSELRIQDDKLKKELKKGGNISAPKLFCYPAQSNFSGVKHSLEWIARAQQYGWHVLLDAAAFVPSSRLDLTKFQPDFTTISFYKMFGYPTGLGALFIRKKIKTVLVRPWFAGGTILFVSTSFQNHIFAMDHEEFEDGTIHFLGIPALTTGLQYLNSIGMDRIERHIRALTHYLLKGLIALRHSNGHRFVRILGPETVHNRGGTVSVDMLDVEGQVLPPLIVEELAGYEKISLRSGCFCNPGDSEMLFPDEWKEIKQILEETGNVYVARRQGLRYAGAVRISVGVPTSIEDLDRVLQFLTKFTDLFVEDLTDGKHKNHPSFESPNSKRKGSKTCVPCHASKLQNSSITDRTCAKPQRQKQKCGLVCDGEARRKCLAYKFYRGMEMLKTYLLLNRLFFVFHSIRSAVRMFASWMIWLWGE